ncbi:F-box/LRR-repeat protein, partial [Corchorus capsularis]
MALAGSQLFIDQIKAREKVPKVNEYPNHQHLKEVEIIGYGGGLYDTKLVIYLLESAVALDKIVINPRSPAVLAWPFMFKDGKKERRARKVALQLKKERPIRAEFV